MIVTIIMIKKAIDTITSIAIALSGIDDYLGFLLAFSTSSGKL